MKLDLIQKINIIKVQRSVFESRLTELRESKKWYFKNTSISLKSREDDLLTGIRFCNYLLIPLQKDKDLGPESLSMLKFIGLGEICTLN